MMTIAQMCIAAKIYLLYTDTIRRINFAKIFQYEIVYDGKFAKNNPRENNRLTVLLLYKGTVINIYTCIHNPIVSLHNSVSLANNLYYNILDRLRRYA